MLESDRCSGRKSLRQRHASCLQELCSSIKSCCNLAFLEPVPLLAALVLPGGEAAQRKAWPWLTPRSELLLFAKHPKKTPRRSRFTIAGIAAGITMVRSPSALQSQKHQSWRRPQRSPSPTHLTVLTHRMEHPQHRPSSPHFPPCHSKIQLLAPRTLKSPCLQT